MAKHSNEGKKITVVIEVKRRKQAPGFGVAVSCRFEDLSRCCAAIIFWPKRWACDGGDSFEVSYCQAASDRFGRKRLGDLKARSFCETFASKRGLNLNNRSARGSVSGKNLRILSTKPSGAAYKPRLKPDVLQVKTTRVSARFSIEDG